ncbi:MAG TPA: Grx4 family monothiol glutaredoxin [Casimicrobium sp.]|jgi:monothiol glutaredoxin|nr:Grx4 family monothiol glutaredoxin [Burkholderiales bacterium]HNY46614.1 Grx4 family monothiol glutaredoxin [Casimicrobium sp.]HPG62409.1 Grx4 family monothiol glutaredoxin [Casimicrobium sp.]HPV23902.1 Grx4 family monothiol glutaredoxin [Casimicrobium sp.]
MSALPDDLKQAIDEIVGSNRVVLFMKGSPQAPMCGFSASAVKMLADAGAGDFAYVNVLEDNEIREGIKAYSSWPTIPQLYIDKEFVGGADIMRELHSNGELATMLAA